jgi:hypothetical protein
MTVFPGGFMRKLLKNQRPTLALILASVYMCVVVPVMGRAWWRHDHGLIGHGHYCALWAVLGLAVAMWGWCWWQYLVTFARKHRSK